MEYYRELFRPYASCPEQDLVQCFLIYIRRWNFKLTKIT